MSKRGRGHDNQVEAQALLAEAAQELQGVLARETQAKLRVLDRVSSLANPADDTYIAQRALVADEAAFFLVELLADEALSVVVRAAEAVARLCAHSGPAQAALAAHSVLHRPALNPVQDVFVDSYNLEGKIAFGGELVQALEHGRLEVLPHLDCCLGSMTSPPKEEVVALMDRSLGPVLSLLARPAGAPAAEQALGLLCAMLEARPQYAEELQGRGALRLVTQLLLRGECGGCACTGGCMWGAPARPRSDEVADVACRALWLLVAQGDARHLLGGSGVNEGEGVVAASHSAADLLGCSPVELVPRLLRLKELAAEQEAQWQEEQEAEDAGAGEGKGALAHLPPVALATRQGPAEVCCAKDAEQLLAVIGGLHPGVQEQMAVVEEAAGTHKPQQPACCIM
eukprot:scaffold19.g1805.t1